MRNRRPIAVVCIVVLFAMALAPLTSLTSLSGTSICAILVPLPGLFRAVVVAPFAAAEPVHVPSSFSTPPLPSRAPPLACSVFSL